MGWFKSLKERHKNATPGPWETFHHKYNAGWTSDGIKQVGLGGKPIFAVGSAACSCAVTQEDAEFITHSHSDISRCVELLEYIAQQSCMSDYQEDGPCQHCAICKIKRELETF